MEAISELFYCNLKCEKSFEFFDKVISGSLVICSILITFYNAMKHIQNYRNPFFQDKIIIILFMSPFYAISSYLSIMIPSLGEYFVFIRDIYEAILLFTFFYLMFAYLAYDQEKNSIIDKQVYIILST